MKQDETVETQIFSTINEIFKHLGSINAKLDSISYKVNQIKTKEEKVNPDHMTPSEAGMDKGRCPI